MPEDLPTPEQDAAIATFRAGEHLVLQAGAGTGKTTTLQMLAASTHRRGRYIAFNKSIAVAARAKFSTNIKCGTAHALAFVSVGHRYGERLDKPRIPMARLAPRLGITQLVQIGGRSVTPSALCHAAMQTVTFYCYSADQLIDRHHVPWLRGIRDQQQHDQLVDIVLPYAIKMWADLQNTDHGLVKFKPDHFLKMWALTEPTITGDFLLLDEAQDTNPVVEQIFLNQRRHAQLVMVGDSAQAIYGWRGARDIMAGAAGTHLALSHSFRFGAGLALEANRWLAIARAPIRLVGAPDRVSSVGKVEHPDAVLCRTNGGAMAEILALLAAGRRVALVGSGTTLSALAFAARDLKVGRRTSHPDLLLFSTWGEVQDYAEWDPDGRDLLPFVNVIDEHGVDVVLDVVSRLSHEDGADVTVSTAHRAKGREWQTVRIADDFPEPVDPDNLDPDGEPLPTHIDPAEARLAYVAVTRARRQLDLGGLSWINRHPDGRLPGGPRPSAAA